MRLSSIALLAGATAVAADNTVTLFLPGFDAQSIEGKVIGSSGSVTSYVLNCPEDVDDTECGLPAFGYTVIEGPSTLQMGYSYDDIAISQECDLQGTTRAACSISYNAGSMTSTFSTAVDIATIPYGGYQEVRITATASGAAATTGASVSTSTASSTGTGSSSSSSSTASSSSGSATASSATGTAATTSAQTSESTNAAMPAVTGHAHWAVGGAAAALALAVV